MLRLLSLLLACASCSSSLHGRFAIRPARPRAGPAPFAVASPPPEDAWSYTTLVRALGRGQVADASMSPDASVRVRDAHGLEHALQILPAQASALADRFADAGVDLVMVPVDPVRLGALQAVDALPVLLVVLYALATLGPRAPNGGLTMFGPRLARNELAVAEDVDTTFEDVAGLRAAIGRVFRDHHRVAALAQSR